LPSGLSPGIRAPFALRARPLEIFVLDNTTGHFNRLERTMTATSITNLVAREHVNELLREAEQHRRCGELSRARRHSVGRRLSGQRAEVRTPIAVLRQLVAPAPAPGGFVTQIGRRALGC
jgi:hypothetical protein